MNGLTSQVTCFGNTGAATAYWNDRAAPRAAPLPPPRRGHRPVVAGLAESDEHGQNLRPWLRGRHGRWLRRVLLLSARQRRPRCAPLEAPAPAAPGCGVAQRSTAPSLATGCSYCEGCCCCCCRRPQADDGLQQGLGWRDDQLGGGGCSSCICCVVPLQAPSATDLSGSRPLPSASSIAAPTAERGTRAARARGAGHGRAGPDGTRAFRAVGGRACCACCARAHVLCTRTSPFLAPLRRACWGNALLTAARQPWRQQDLQLREAAPAHTTAMRGRGGVAGAASDAPARARRPQAANRLLATLLMMIDALPYGMPADHGLLIYNILINSLSGKDVYAHLHTPEYPCRRSNGCACPARWLPLHRLPRAGGSARRGCREGACAAPAD